MLTPDIHLPNDRVQKRVLQIARYDIKEPRAEIPQDIHQQLNFIFHRRRSSVGESFTITSFWISTILLTRKRKWYLLTCNYHTFRKRIRFFIPILIIMPSTNFRVRLWQLIEKNKQIFGNIHLIRINDELERLQQNQDKDKNAELIQGLIYARQFVEKSLNTTKKQKYTDSYVYVY